MAIYLSRKKGGVTPTSITPSNSNPATLTANTAVTPTANGYAIENYLDVYPDNDYPAQIASDVVVVFKGAGHVIEDAPITAIPNDNNPPELDEECIYIIRNNTGYLYETQPVTPTSITPSNSNPVALTANNPVNPTSSGYAIYSYGNLEPSNASPVYLYGNSIYKVTTAGYAISSYTNKTPSDSSPASVSSGAIIKNAGSSTGYLYASSGLKKFKNGTFTMSSTSGTVDTVTLGFQPKYICMYNNPTGTPTLMSVYDENFSTTKWIRVSSLGIAVPNIGNSQNFNINSITNTGFTTRAYNGATVRYFAIG